MVTGFYKSTIIPHSITQNDECYRITGGINEFHDFRNCFCLGHFLHLRLLPTTTIRTLKSPTFGMTKETCRLEMYAHQSGNKNGKLRIVIEPVNSFDATTASSWVPIEQNGNDNRKWTELTFPIGRVSQDFRILFEVVPIGLRSQQRGHVR